MTVAITILRVHPFAGWEAAQTSTLIAAFIAVVGVMATILTTSARAHREHKADLYATALGGVADYLEGPYRIRRKDGTPAHRNAITAALSDVKSTIDHSQELLRLHAPQEVADAYDNYVVAAKLQAGQQMRLAWDLSPISSDSDVSLHTTYDRALCATYRANVIGLMQADLDRRFGNPWRFAAYRKRVRDGLAKPTPLASDVSVSESETPPEDTPTRR